MSPSSKVTEKYQVTIPKEIREKWGLQAGDIIVFEPQEIGVKIEKLDEFQKKYFGMLSGRGHSIRDLKETRKTMWLRS